MFSPVDLRHLAVRVAEPSGDGTVESLDVARRVPPLTTVELAPPVGAVLLPQFGGPLLFKVSSVLVS